MSFYLSLSLYILTFLIGLFLNSKGDKNSFKILFVIWLYMFLCFGYMTGSDWRTYEIEYNQAGKTGYTIFLTDIGFNFSIIFLSKILHDFFLALGLLKCLYLFTLIELFKRYTNNWLTAVIILMPVSLLFMLIDNPLRFMVALIFVNLGLIEEKKDSRWKTYLFLSIAPFFHITTIVFLFLPFVIKISYKLYSSKNYLIIVSYIIITYISSNPVLIENVKNNIVGQMLMFMEMKDYTQSYNIEDNGAFFTLGSILQIFIFGIIILSKKYIKNNNRLKQLYGLSIIYLFLSRILILVPTGYRLAIPLGYFYAIYISELYSNKKIIGYILASYLFLVMIKNINIGYVYAPYTNSIPYILTNTHIDYNKRSNHNLEAYYKRTGEYFEHQNN